jgi:hypothetical protein
MSAKLHDTGEHANNPTFTQLDLFSVEVWKPVIDFPDYEASGLGVVRSIKFGKERILKPKLNRSGYHQVNLCSEGKKKMMSIHRLVIETFHGKSDLQVNHKNFDKTDNRLSNLEYVTQRENSHHYHQQKQSSSRFMGVSWQKSTGKWASRIHHKGNLFYLGSFASEPDAAFAYRLTRFAVEYHAAHKATASSALDYIMMSKALASERHSKAANRK